MKVKHIKQIFFSLPSQTSRINEMSSEQTKKRKQTFQQPTTKKTTNTEKKDKHTQFIQLICSCFLSSSLNSYFSSSFAIAICDEQKIKLKKKKRRIKRATENIAHALTLAKVSKDMINIQIFRNIQRFFECVGEESKRYLVGVSAILKRLRVEIPENISNFAENVW